MEVTLTRKSDQFYEGQNQAGHCIELAGRGQAVGPMESLLLAGAACACIDLEIILQKMQQSISTLSVVVSGDRADHEIPRVFRKVHLHFVLTGSLDPEKVRKALELSVEKYCSVLSTLSKTAEISYDFEVTQI